MSSLFCILLAIIGIAVSLYLLPIWLFIICMVTGFSSGYPAEGVIIGVILGIICWFLMDHCKIFEDKK